MKNMGLASILAVVLLAGGLAWAGVVHAGQPLDCAPEDREVAGNTNTDCKWDYGMDDVAGVRFVVLEREGANACYGALEFHPYNFEDLAPSQDLSITLTATNSRTGQPPGTRQERVSVRYEPGESALRAVGDTYDLTDPVSDNWLIGGYYGVTLPSTRWHHVQVRPSGGPTGVNYPSRWFPIPTEVNDFPVMLNACLAGVKLRLETEAQLEEDRAKLAAQELARQQALAEEQAKAALDAERLAAAWQALKVQQEIELTKTRSLIARLERDKIIIAVWNDIVLERLRGFQERAEITNRYLAEVEANAADFNARVREKYEELQRLEELNQAIADSIAAHNQEIEAQLAAAAELEARNLEKLEDLAVTPPTPAPTPGG